MRDRETNLRTEIIVVNVKVDGDKVQKWVEKTALSRTHGPRIPNYPSLFWLLPHL